MDAREWTALHDDVFSAERLKSPDRAVNDRLDPGCFRLPPTQVHQLLKAACWIRGWSYPKTLTPFISALSTPTFNPVPLKLQ